MSYDPTSEASAARVRELERKVAQLTTANGTLASTNERTARILKDARDQIVKLRAEIERIAAPPNTYGVILEVHGDDTADVFTGGRRMRVAVSTELAAKDVVPGRDVRLNEALVVIGVAGSERSGEVVLVEHTIDAERVVVVLRNDEQRVVRVAASLAGERLRAGEAVLLDTKSGFVTERMPHAEVNEVLLEEVPDISYSDIGGLEGQIEQIRDAVEMPFLHPELYREHHLKAPKGVLLYGPPGCGKTMIAKAVAASLARQVAAKAGVDAKDAPPSYFLNIKGP